MIQDLDPYGTSDIKRKDFIEQLTNELKYVFKGINPLWAEVCARTALATGLKNIKIAYAGRPLSLNQFNMCIGMPGSKKTLPLRYAQAIISRLNYLSKHDYIFPEKFSVAGMTDQLSELKKGSEKKYPPVYKYECGTIFRDEFTALFKQARKVDWAIDMLEFLSELYDGYSSKKRTKEHGLQKAPESYVNLLTTTTYDFLSKVDDDFFNQGTGTRFLYTVIEPDDITIEHLDRRLFQKNAIKDRETTINKYAELLRKLYSITELKELRLTMDAFRIWNEHDFKVHNIWLSKARVDPTNWEYPYLNRLPEYTLKLAGLYSISRQIEFLIRLKENDRLEQLEDITIEGMDVERAKATVLKHHEEFKKLVRLRRTITGRIKAVSHQSLVDAIVEVLRKFPKGMATHGQWFATQTIVSSEKTFDKYRDTSIVKGKVVLIGREHLSPEDLKRMKVRTSSKVYKVRKM